MTDETNDATKRSSKPPVGHGGVVIRSTLSPQASDTTETAGATAVRVEASVARRAADGTVDLSLMVTGITAAELEGLWCNHIEPIVKRLQGIDAEAP